MTGAGKGSNLNLAELRLKDKEAIQNRAEGQSRAHEVETEFEGQRHATLSQAVANSAFQETTEAVADQDNHDFNEAQAELGIPTDIPSRPHDNDDIDNATFGTSSNITTTSGPTLPEVPPSHPPPNFAQVPGSVDSSPETLSDTLNLENVPDEIPATANDNIRSAPALTFQEPFRRQEWSEQYGSDTVLHGTMGEHAGSSRARMTRRKQPRRGSSISLSSMARYLDKGTQGLHYHIAKCCSISKPTIASWLPLTLSSHRVHTAASQFRQHYARPGTNDINQKRASFYEQSATSYLGQNMNEPRISAHVVALLMKCWTSGRSDEDVESQLTAVLPDDEEERRMFANAADKRGVTPLHLAVAYGYPGVAALLLRVGADPDARTIKGTSIDDFARPAARLAGQRLTLYFRILHCRTWIMHGQQPPAPRKVSTATAGAHSKRRTLKRKRPNDDVAAQQNTRSTTNHDPLVEVENMDPSTSQRMPPPASTAVETPMAWYHFSCSSCVDSIHVHQQWAATIHRIFDGLANTNIRPEQLSADEQFTVVWCDASRSRHSHYFWYADILSPDGSEPDIRWPQRITGCNDSVLCSA